MSEINEKEERIINTIELIYGDKTDDLLDDLRFLHEYRQTMKSMGGWVMKGTITALIAGLAAAVWAGLKILVVRT